MYCTYKILHHKIIPNFKSRGQCTTMLPQYNKKQKILFNDNQNQV